MSNSAHLSDGTVSLAQAKLLRQQERIQQAEAALYNPPPIEKPRYEQSRIIATKSIWNSIDNDRAPQRSQPSEAGIEVRINKYSAAPTRDHSLSRSLSSVSQQTNLGALEAVENEDNVEDDAGFQVWTRRGGRGVKAPGDGETYSDKPDIEKQKTVEATYDKNEILEVFKQELPSPDFLGMYPGTRNGQVQFVQHPNGDVAAHMWSAQNWMWDNIGHFSNIRKRTEGQLAGERLKGETAYQKLQQHTLAYFRILAKQREATVMGTPFGQDNIKSALPEPVVVTSPKVEIITAAPKEIVRPILSALQRPPGVERPSDLHMPIPQRQDDPFSADTNDYSNAFSWQSRFVPNSTSFAAQQALSHNERRHQMSSESTPTREALRDQLHKTVDIATKRSLSQANISRTVLHDPIQASLHEEQRYEPSPPVFSGAYIYPTWQDTQFYASQLHAARKTSILNLGSVPDMDDYEPLPPSKSQDTGGYLRPGPAKQPPIAPKPVQKSYDEELNDWWMGGKCLLSAPHQLYTLNSSLPE